MTMPKKPSRRVLLRVIGELQDLLGEAHRANGDRNENRLADVTAALGKGMDLCIAARAADDPDEKPSGLLGIRYGSIG